VAREVSIKVRRFMAFYTLLWPNENAASIQKK
jgi:hypothetical protein